MNNNNEFKIAIIFFAALAAVFALGYTVGVGDAQIECVDKVKAVLR